MPKIGWWMIKYKSLIHYGMLWVDSEWFGIDLGWFWVISSDFDLIWGDSRLIQVDSKFIWSDSSYAKILLNNRKIGQKIRLNKNEEVGCVSMGM